MQFAASDCTRSHTAGRSSCGNVESVPSVIDDIKNTTDKAYCGKPDRLFLIDTQGKVAYRGKRGPFGFSPPELEAAIKKLLGTGGAIKTLTPAERVELLARTQRLHEEQQNLENDLLDLEIELEVKTKARDSLNQSLASATF